MRAFAATLRNLVVSGCRAATSQSQADLFEACDHSGIRDKGLHDAVGLDKHTFSKMRARTRDFPLPLVDSLPLHVRVAFHKRCLARLGYDVRPADPEQLADALATELARVERIVEQLKSVTRPRPVKVDPYA